MIEYPALTSENLSSTAHLFANRYDMMTWISSRFPGDRIAEVGVAFGDFSEFLIELFAPNSFVAIDTFVIHTLDDCMGIPVGDRLKGLTHEDYYRQRIIAGPHTVEVVNALSHEGLARFQDDFFDLIYLDAGHTYEDIARDIAVAVKKLHRYGILVCNDYTCFDQRDGVAGGPYGVVPAVNQLLAEGGFEVMGFALEKLMFCDIALRRKC